ncbi:hypothetical protein MMC24_007599 [Lignoscripta atroalba]|nr:hypothetical protein [Lignoscripta atroalba]
MVSTSSSSIQCRRTPSRRFEPKPFTFLHLPGELRNRIYNYAFPHQDFDIIWLTPHRDLTYCVYQERHPNFSKNESGDRWWCARNVQPESGFWRPPLGPSTSRRRRQLDLPRRSRFPDRVNYELSPGPAALLLTCHQVCREACHALYGNSAFSFSSRKLLQKFLESVGSVASASIKNLRLQHETYGEPYRTEFRRWKEVHDKLWEDACWDAAECLTSLENLSVTLLINGRPLKLNLAAPWAAPLLAFRGRALKNVAVHLLSRDWRDEKRLKSCAQVVRRELLGADYREDEEAGKNKSGGNLPKALRCIIIR